MLVRAVTVPPLLPAEARPDKWRPVAEDRDTVVARRDLGRREAVHSLHSKAGVLHPP